MKPLLLLLCLGLCSSLFAGSYTEPYCERSFKNNSKKFSDREERNHFLKFLHYLFSTVSKTNINSSNNKFKVQFDIENSYFYMQEMSPFKGLLSKLLNTDIQLMEGAMHRQLTEISQENNGLLIQNLVVFFYKNRAYDVSVEFRMHKEGSSIQKIERKLKQYNIGNKTEKSFIFLPPYVNLHIKPSTTKFAFDKR